MSGKADKTIHDILGEERKAGQENGTIPDWMTTGGYQMFKGKYVYEGQTVRDTYMRIASAAARHMKKDGEEKWRDRFFTILWKAWLAASTPVLSNMGTKRGCPVSCSGGYVGDSIYDFYNSQLETAMLTKNGFGTSGYLGDIRSRGSAISVGGHSSGVVPVFKDFVQLTRDVSQGNTRRGAWAGYIELEHPDFFELTDHLLAEPDDLNIGWLVTDKFIERLNSGDEDALARFQRAMKAKCITGKGYFVFIDRANRDNPPMYEQHGLSVKASNLCTEIFLHSDHDHTYTCVLSSMNLAKFDEWKDTDAVFWATVFLDCVAQEFIEIGRTIPGLEKAVRFTERGRALGLGALGFHTYLQSKMVAFEEFQAHMINMEIFDHMDKESLRASKWMAEQFGEPEWCRGYGVHNTHRLAVAPNTSSALICGGVSQGIEPFVDNIFNQPTSAGEIERINPEFLKLLKKKGKYTKAVRQDIIENNGSVQHLDWLTDHEKMVFKTAFEIDQMAIIRLASTRQQYIDQGQSLNLFFDADESEAYISKVHEAAFKDARIKALYYMRSRAGVQAAKDECVACEG